MKSRRSFRSPLIFCATSLLFLSQACVLSRQTVNLPATRIPQASSSPTPIEGPPLNVPTFPIPESTPTQPAVNVPSSATAAQVTVTALHGRLSIRKGPDPVFDAIGTLPDGRTAKVIARSVLDGWVEILIPDQIGKTGWVSIKTVYGVVSGNVLNLPEILIVEWPFGSYLRNCTQHILIVEPGDKILPLASSSVDNHVWFYPGLYMIFDQGMSERPWIMDVNLSQHTSVDIHKDGSGQKTNCP